MFTRSFSFSKSTPSLSFIILRIKNATSHPSILRFIPRLSFLALLLEVVLYEKMSEEDEECHDIVKICHRNVAGEFIAPSYQ